MRAAAPTLVARTALWLAAVAALSGLLLLGRGWLDKSHIALAYVAVTLAASAFGGRAAGMVAAIGAFVAFDVFFLPPYGTFVVANPADWVVLVAFLATSLLAGQLFHRAEQRRLAESERAAEVDRLATLGTEALASGRAADALAAAAEVIRAALDADVCEIWTRTDDAAAWVREAPAVSAGGATPPPLLDVAATDARTVIERRDGTTRLGAGIEVTNELLQDVGDPASLLVPLVARGHTVAVLRVARAAGLSFTPARTRYLRALSYYAALAAERLRLIGTAERADALRAEATAKDAVLAAVSHDLRTPLTSIRGLAHELAEQGDERALVIEEEATRLARMVGSLLDLSRLTAEATERLTSDVRRPASGSRSGEPNEVEDLIGVALQRVEGTAGAGRISVSLDPAHPLLLGRFDLSDTVRALVNLLDNAVQHSPPGAPVELAAVRDGGEIVLRVADRGPGVPDAERERIFEPWVRRRGTADGSGGAGLGLALARATAIAQGGSLRHEPRDGGGSVFVLRLPALDVEALAADE